MKNHSDFYRIAKVDGNPAGGTTQTVDITFPADGTYELCVTAANVCDTQVDQPYFNGTAQSLTWSANSGDNFFTIAGADANEDWWQNKIGEILDLFDSNGNGVIDGDEIIDIQRSQFFDSTAEYIVFINSYFGSNYASQTGSSLLKVKRFTTNGYLDANKNVMENAKELLANMRGIFLYINGQYELSIEDTGTSSFSINDNHIIADAGISVDYGNKDKKANKVIVEFFNANKKYELDTATVLHDATPEYYSDDGDEILEIKAEFPYITDPYIAYNMGKAILTRSRNQTTMQFLGTPEMYKLNVGDIVDLTYAGLGFSGKVCRVEALELQSNGLVAVSLIEYFDVYTWEVPPQEPVEELANLPSAYAVKPPTNISFTDSDSSPTGRPFLSWDEPTDFPDYQYRVNVVDSSGNQLMNRMVDVESCDLTFIPTGLFVANITSLNTLGVESSPARFPTTGNFTVGTPPTGSGDIQDGAVDLDALAAEVQSAINAGGVDSTQLIKSTSAPTTRNDGSALQAQDLWADTDDDNQIYVRNSSNNGWEKARDSSLVTLYNSLSSTVTTNSSNIATAQSDIVTLTTDTSANASAITSLTSTVNSNTSAITTEQTTRANADSALAADITSLTSTVNGNTASITTNATAITDINGNASASYVLQLNANGKVAQMVLESNADAGTGATSTIAFLADTFKIDNDAGSSVSPFVVSGGSVLIDNARINNLSADKILIDGVTLDTDGSGNLIIKSGGVDTGQIKDNAIINDKIAANQITADKIITTDLFLPTNGGEKTGTTLGYWNENDLNYRHVAEIGSGAGFYTGYVRVYKGSFAGQVKGISFLVSDGTYGSGSSYDVNTVVSFYDVTKITESASHAIYVSTDLEYLTGGWITASRLTTAKDSGNIPIAFRYTGTGTLNFFIYAEGDSNTQYIGGCDVRLVKFST